jgi:hypothetical protein
MTRRRYLDEEYLDSCEAEVVAADNGWLSLSDTVAYPGGGGQPADHARVEVAGEAHPVGAFRVDKSGATWVLVNVAIPVGTVVTCRIDWGFRYAVMRHHALMHIVNTIAGRRYHGQHTGTQHAAGRLPSRRLQKRATWAGHAGGVARCWSDNHRRCSQHPRLTRPPRQETGPPTTGNMSGWTSPVTRTYMSYGPWDLARDQRSVVRTDSSSVRTLSSS